MVWRELSVDGVAGDERVERAGAPEKELLHLRKRSCICVKDCGPSSPTAGTRR